MIESSPNTPFLRVFAGPNGSGKSTIKLKVSPADIGVYLNPDEIQKKINETNQLDFDNFGIKATLDDFRNFADGHTLLEKFPTDELDKLSARENKILFPSDYNLYLIPLISDFIRHCLIKNRISFTFETVMSSFDKVEFMQKTKNEGYQVFLHFVATDDPEINVERVARRVKLGGHHVETEKILNRYYKALRNLTQAVQWCDQVYLIDNSGLEAEIVAEIINGNKIKYKFQQVPQWIYDYITHPLGLYPEM